MNQFSLSVCLEKISLLLMLNKKKNFLNKFVFDFMKRVLSARHQTRQHEHIRYNKTHVQNKRIKQSKENSSSLALMLICSKQLSQTLINEIMRRARDIERHRERETHTSEVLFCSTAWRPWDAHNEFFSNLQSLSLFSSTQKTFHLCTTQLCVCCLERSREHR